MATPCGTVLCLCILQLVHVSGQTPSLDGPTSGVLGSSVHLICTLPGNSTLVGGFSRAGVTGSMCTVNIATCSQFTASEGYSCACLTGETREVYLNISSLSLQDDDTWRCTYNAVNSNNLRLSVYYAPDISSSFPNNKDVTENSSPNIDCSSGLTAGKPSDTSYTWTGPRGYSKSGFLLDRRVSRSQGGSYTCTARNSAGLSDSAQVNINVQYAPEISSSFPKNKNVTENSSPNIDCRSGLTAGNPSDTSYTWTGSGDYSKSGSVLDRSVSRSQGGPYTCTARNSAGLTDSAQVNINVQYLDRPILTLDQSEVRENESVGLKCSAASQPTALLTVRNVDNDTVVVQQETDELTYTIPRAQCLHNGSFVCSAEHETFGVLYSPAVQLNVICSPRLDTRKPLKRNISSSLNEIASLLVNVISNPAPTFRWYLRDNQQLVPIPNITQHEIISTAKFSVLQIHLTHSRDYASYVVEATSNHVTFTTTFNLLPTGLSSQRVQSDRFSVGIGIGIAALLPVVIVAFGVIIYLCFKLRNLAVMKGPEANRETETEMVSAYHNDNRRTYSDLTSTPANEYEELKVQRSEENENPIPQRVSSSQGTTTQI